MKRIFEVVAIGCSLPLIEAGSFVWNGNEERNVGAYIPAQETGMGRNIQTLAMGPEPTSPAQLRKERSGLFANRRDTDDPPASVCGYLEGSSGRQLGRSEWTCFANFSLMCDSVPICLRGDRFLPVHNYQRDVGRRLLSYDVAGLQHRNDMYRLIGLGHFDFNWRAHIQLVSPLIPRET